MHTPHSAMLTHQLHEVVNRLHCRVRAFLASDRQCGQSHKKVSVVGRRQRRLTAAAAATTTIDIHWPVWCSCRRSTSHAASPPPLPLSKVCKTFAPLSSSRPQAVSPPSPQPYSLSPLAPFPLVSLPFSISFAFSFAFSFSLASLSS